MSNIFDTIKTGSISAGLFIVLAIEAFKYFGFGSAGIVLNSIAAKCQSSIGDVKPDSIFAN